MRRYLALVHVLVHDDLLTMGVIDSYVLAVCRGVHLPLVVGAARGRMMLMLRTRLPH